MNDVATLTRRTGIGTPCKTLGQLLEQLGGISPERVRVDPPLGTATVEDVIAMEVRENRLCELVDGILVEKVTGFRESLLAGAMLSTLRAFVNPRNLGLVTGADGMMQLFPGLVRIPDVAFAAWARFPDGKVPEDPVPRLVPDLVVEVLSPGNTPGEMKRKLGEYFDAGVRLVWFVDAHKRTVAVYTKPTRPKVLSEADTLDGRKVLPGFRLALKDLFAELDRCGGR